jgi:hypothetical protein
LFWHDRPRYRGSQRRRFRTILLVRHVPDMLPNLSGTESYCKGTTNSKNTRHEPYNPLCSTTRVLAAMWVFSARLCLGYFRCFGCILVAEWVHEHLAWLQTGCRQGAQTPSASHSGCNLGAKRVQKGCTPCSERGSRPLTPQARDCERATTGSRRLEARAADESSK